MRKNTDTQTTLLDLTRAAIKGWAVTFTYKKDEDTDEEVRTVEAEDVRATEDGFFLLVGWDRFRQARRTFRTDRVVSYTVHRVTHTAAHRAFLKAEETEQLLADLQTPAVAPTTAGGYAAHGDWLAGRADRAEARGLADEAERLWDLADLAWELAELG